MSSWDLIVRQRAWMWCIGVLFAGLGIACWGASIWNVNLMTAASITTMLAIQAFSAHTFLGQIAKLQAALDMKALHARKPVGLGEIVELQPGDIRVLLNQPATLHTRIRAHTTCKLEVLP